MLFSNFSFKFSVLFSTWDSFACRQDDHLHNLRISLHCHIHNLHVQLVHTSHIFADFYRISCCAHISDNWSIFGGMGCILLSYELESQLWFHWVCSDCLLSICKCLWASTAHLSASWFVPLLLYLVVVILLECPLQSCSLVLCRRSHTLNYLMFCEGSLSQEGQSTFWFGIIKGHCKLYFKNVSQVACHCSWVSLIHMVHSFL